MKGFVMDGNQIEGEKVERKALYCTYTESCSCSKEYSYFGAISKDNWVIIVQYVQEQMSHLILNLFSFLIMDGFKSNWMQIKA